MSTFEPKASSEETTAPNSKQKVGSGDSFIRPPPSQLPPSSKPKVETKLTFPKPPSINVSVNLGKKINTENKPSDASLVSSILVKKPEEAPSDDKPKVL